MQDSAFRTEHERIGDTIADAPPSNAIILQKLMFCHPLVSEAAADSLRLVWEKVDIENDKIVWFDRRSVLCDFDGLDYVTQGIFSGTYASVHTYSIDNEGKTAHHWNKIDVACCRFRGHRVKLTPLCFRTQPG
jgi:hypothetical protein